ncbi:MAG: hypothetical protein HC884_20110, partial [Chloroflexaceae bacterium]|nr:hypothetical protein [Chloroflexaceae bacterium]
TSSFACPTTAAPPAEPYTSNWCPGPYGVLKRRCQCGTLLPTSEVNGREQLQAFCPHCGRELPPGGRDTQHGYLPTIGGRAVGKSISALDQGQGQEGPGMDPAASHQVLQPMDWILEPESIPEPEPPEPERWRSRKVAYLVGTILASVILLIVLVGGAQSSTATESGRCSVHLRQGGRRPHHRGRRPACWCSRPTCSMAAPCSRQRRVHQSCTISTPENG